MIRLLESVRLGVEYYDRLPRQLSGGEKQRVAIARAFAGRPSLVLCDEPLSALDVSVQVAVMNLLLEFQQGYGSTMLFISHDLSVVYQLCDQVAVMYLGQFCEVGPPRIFTHLRIIRIRKHCCLQSPFQIRRSKELASG